MIVYSEQSMNVITKSIDLKNNSHLGKNKENYSNRKIIANHNSNFMLGNGFVLLLSFFSIAFIIGIQTEIQPNYAFAQVNVEPINENIEDNGTKITTSSESESESEAQALVRELEDDGIDITNSSESYTDTEQAVEQSAEQDSQIATAGQSAEQDTQTSISEVATEEAAEQSAEQDSQTTTELAAEQDSQTTTELAAEEATETVIDRQTGANKPKFTSEMILALPSASIK